MLRPTIDTLSPTEDPARVDSYASDRGLLFARVFAGAAGTFSLFDGTELTTELAGAAPLVVSATTGREAWRGVVFEIVGLSGPPAFVREADGELSELADLSALEASAADASGWAWSDETGGTLYVKLPPGSHLIEITP